MTENRNRLTDRELLPHALDEYIRREFEAKRRVPGAVPPLKEPHEILEQMRRERGE